MNKKLSLMLAAFVAAGWSLTAEAGVVKIANPSSGNSYVIAEDGLKDVTTNGKLQLLNGGTANEGLVMASTGSTSTLKGPWALWEMSYDQNGDMVLWNAGEAAKSVSAGYLFNLNGKAVLNGKSGTPLNYQNEVISGLDLVANQQVKFGGNTSLYFYAATNAINSNADATSLEGRTIQIGDRYLVILADGSNKPALVTATEYGKIAAVAPANVVWTIGTDGVVSTANKNISGNKNIAISQSNGTLSFGWAPTGTSIEINEAEGLAGFTDNGEFYQFLTNGSVKKITEGFTNADKKKFASVLHSENQYIASAPVLNGYDFIGGTTVTGSFLMGFNDGTDNKFIFVNSTGGVTNTIVTPNKGTDEAYIWTPIQNADKSYTFVATVKGKEVYMTIQSYKNFFIDGAPNGFRLYVLDSNGTKLYVKSDMTATGTVSDAVVFGAYQGASVAFTAEELIEYQGTSFMLDLTDAQDDKDLNQNPFADKALVPMKVVWNSNRTKVVDFEFAIGNEEGYFLNIAGTEDYIVVDRDQQWTTDQLGAYIADGGYKFITFTKDNLLKYLNEEGKQSERDLLYNFSINHVPGAQNIKAGKISDITVTNFDGSTIYYLVSYNSNKNYYLTVNADKQNLVTAAFGTKYAITVASAENNPFNDRYVTITFANHKSIKTNALTGTSVPLNGKVLGMSENGNYVAPQAADKVRLDAPEGQWAVLALPYIEDGKNTSLTGNETQFTFVNRESGVGFTVNKLYWIEGDKYAVEHYNTFANGCARDTMIIANANVSKDAYGSVIMEDAAYANYKAADILDQEYRLIVKSTQSDYYVSENHAGQHLLGITEDETDAVNWQIVPMTAARMLDKDGYMEVPTDTVYNIQKSQYWKNGALYQTSDTLAMISYVFKNTANGEFMTYENPQTHDVLSMICDPKSENYLLAIDDADDVNKLVNKNYRFIIKKKAEGKANIIGVKSVLYTPYSEYRTLDLEKKLYGATTQKNGAVEVEGAYNRINSNDLFEVAKVDAPEYKLVNRGDTIRLFRAEDEYSVMYENGQFLNLGNTASIKDIKPALFVDTAFVNRTDEFGKNNRYQYLLVVEPKYVPAVPCDIPGHPELHPDTTYGRFLINMIDSAVWTNANGAIHNNKFINDTEADETYVKLGFHYGYRTQDKLYLTDKTFTEVEKVLNLNSRDFNIAKFAFRYTDAASNDENGSFKIQTRYIDYNDAIKGEGDIYESNEGFLKTINGVVVVTEGYAKGEEFNLVAEKSDPTANESINAANNVIVAGVDGAVVVKGAEGKNVIVSTILGKVVANEVVSSDNATIAAPAGIVVVSVDGESFKVVVK